MLKKKAKFPLRMTQFVHLWTKAVYFGTISCNFIHVIVEKKFVFKNMTTHVRIADFMTTHVNFVS